MLQTLLKVCATLLHLVSQSLLLLGRAPLFTTHYGYSQVCATLLHLVSQSLLLLGRAPLFTTHYGYSQVCATLLHLVSQSLRWRRVAHTCE